MLFCVLPFQFLEGARSTPNPIPRRARPAKKSMLLDFIENTGGPRYMRSFYLQILASAIAN